MKGALNTAVGIAPAYRDLYRKKWKEYGGEEQAGKNQEKPFVKHLNLSWSARKKGWRNNGNGNFRNIGNLGDLAVYAQPVSKTNGQIKNEIDKRNSVYVSHNKTLMHNVLHRNLNHYKKIHDDKVEAERKAKEEAERKRLAEIELKRRRNNRHTDINNLVGDSHRMIDPLFKRNIGQYKSTPGKMSQNYIDQIKNSAGSNKPSDRWYPKDLGTGAVKATMLYEERDKLLKDEKEKVRQQGLADSIEKADEERKEYENKRKEADRLKRESDKAKAQQMQNLRNKKANFNKNSARAYEGVSRFMNSQYNNAHRNALKPTTFTKNTARDYYETNRDKGNEVVERTKDLKKSSALGARDFTERVDLTWADKMIANNPL